MTGHKQGALWWVFAITTPLAVFGGPIALANLFSEVVEWRGPITYIVAFWDVELSEPIIKGLNSILTRLNLPELNPFVGDYLVFGALLSSQKTRSQVVFNAILKELGEDSALLLLLPRNPFVLGFFVFLFWPMVILLDIASLKKGLGKPIHYSTVFRSEDWVNNERRYLRNSAMFALAPFVLFAILWAVNTSL